MASPSNASEPDSSEEEIDSPDDEEVIDTGFDLLLFWDQYRQVILLASGVILIALVAFGIYEYNQQKFAAAAAAALAQAAGDDDYRQVIARYPNSVAAGDAALFLASSLRKEGKYDEALQVLEDFMEKYPDHPLLDAGDLSYAETLEAQGKTDDAIARYEEVAAKYPNSYSAPVALLTEANIVSAQGKIEQARRLYENFVAQFPDSVFARDATAEMHFLRPAPGAAAESAPAPKTNLEGLPDFSNAVPAASASPH